MVADTCPASALSIFGAKFISAGNSSPSISVDEWNIGLSGVMMCHRFSTMLIMSSHLNTENMPPCMEKHDISHNGGGLLGVECPGENPGHYLGHVVAEYAAGDKSQNEPAQGCQLVDNAFDKTVNQCSSRYY